MYELPLFPLQAVLLPGTSLRLHIFEERYKRMINLCLNTGHPFGVVLIRHGVEALGALADPYLIGCTAQVVQVQHLPEGRMNIAATGQERFNILSLNNQLQPYLVGYVEPNPLRHTDALSLKASGSQLRLWVEQYLNILAEAGVSQLALDQLLDNPADLAYMASAFVQMSNREKQELLSLDLAEDVVEEMIRVYRREIALLKAMLARGSHESGVVSTN